MTDLKTLPTFYRGYYEPSLQNEGYITTIVTDLVYFSYFFPGIFGDIEEISLALRKQEQFSEDSVITQRSLVVISNPKNFSFELVYVVLMVSPEREQFTLQVYPQPFN